MTEKELAIAEADYVLEQAIENAGYELHRHMESDEMYQTIANLVSKLLEDFQK